MNRDEREITPVARHQPGAGWRASGEAVEQLRLPVTLGAGDADDLAALEREADRPEGLALQTVDVQHLPGLCRLRCGGGEGRLERTAHDQLDEFGFGRVARRGGALHPAVTQHRDAVRDLEHLGEPVADVHHADAALAACRDRAVQGLDLVRPQGRRRFVEQEHPRVRDERLGDFEQLALGQRECAGG